MTKKDYTVTITLSRAELAMICYSLEAAEPGIAELDRLEDSNDHETVYTPLHTRLMDAHNRAMKGGE